MDKSLQIQRQVRENSEELQDYLKDLVNWEKEMKRKELEIKERTVDDPVLPPIRTARSSAKRKKTKDKKTDAAKEECKKSKEKEKVKKAARIPGHDYRAWDLFNVDDALKEVDQCETEENRKSSSEEVSEESEEEMYAVEKKMQLALLEKDEGNQFFRKGNYDMAILCYTKGIEYDSSNAVLPANRAMALLKKGQLAAAETDCSTCLSMDPTYVKAYLRRGTARVGLKKYEDARQDFCKVLDLDPDNNQAKLELERLQKEMLLSKNKITDDSIENEKIGNELTKVPKIKNECDKAAGDKLAKSSYQYSNLHDLAEDEVKSSSMKPSDRLQQLLKPDDKDSCIISAIQKPLHLRSQKPMKTIKIKDVSGITESSALTESEKVQNIIIPLNNDDNADNEPATVVEEQSESIEENRSASPTSPTCSSYSSESFLKNSETCPLTFTAPSLPDVPLTSYQFLSDWKKLKHYPQSLYEYIKQFPPERLPIIFKQSIDTDLFSGVLQVLSTKFVENCDDVLSYLSHLRGVGRFKTLVMFLAEEEISALRRMFHFIKSSQKYSIEEIQNVEKDYDLS